jgi:AcrR family transcriptional regulator
MTGTQREKAIEGRRRRVIEAATLLLGERPDGIFSMQELARRSGVSLATPYNLFGSKGTVLAEVFARQIRGFQQNRDAVQSGSAVERVEDTVDRLVLAFERQPGFFRNLWKALGSLSPTEHRELIVPVSSQLLHPLVAGLQAEKLISNEVAPHAIATTLVRIFDANFEMWAAQDWPVALLRQELLSGFSLCLLGLVDDRERTELLQLIGRPDRELERQARRPGASKPN